MIPDKEMIVLLLEEVGFMEIARDAMLEDNKDILRGYFQIAKIKENILNLKKLTMSETTHD
jgi:hypothetical protein